MTKDTIEFPDWKIEMDIIKSSMDGSITKLSISIKRVCKIELFVV